MDYWVIILLSNWQFAVFTTAQDCGQPKSVDRINLGQVFSVPQRPRTTNRIVGGTDVVDASGGQFCWQVGILVGDSEEFNCGGSIVDKRTVVTAAHCVVNGRGWTREALDFKVVVGALSSRFDGVKPKNESAAGCGRSYQVAKVVKHEEYRKFNNDNDIAVLVLQEDFDFTKRCMCPVCLTSQVPKVGEVCVASGYGNENEVGLNRRSIPLRWVYLQVLQQDPNKCSVISNTDLKLFICAGQNRNQDTCQGDSGGPFVCWNREKRSYYLAGIVSFGDGCGRGIGGQYTKVANYLNWIRTNSVI